MKPRYVLSYVFNENIPFGMKQIEKMINWVFSGKRL